MASDDRGGRVRLLDDEDALTDELVACLKHIFAKYCTPKVESTTTATGLLEPPESAVLDEDGLDRWAVDTNGVALSADEKTELEMLDVDEAGRLTFEGFTQLYQLQTENDEGETWRDLVRTLIAI